MRDLRQKKNVNDSSSVKCKHEKSNLFVTLVSFIWRVCFEIMAVITEKDLLAEWEGRNVRARVMSGSAPC
jgi:hypothetical protein